MKNDRHCKQSRTVVSSNPFWAWMKGNALILGIASLIWLVFKSGQKPSRIQYPCQKAAATHVGLFLLPFLLPLMHKTYGYLRTLSLKQGGRFVAVTLVSIGLILSTAQLWGRHQQYMRAEYYKQLRVNGPFGKKAAAASGLAAGFMTIPHAMAIPSPHRVVSVHHSGATDWDFRCTSSGPCSAYYGDDAFVDQAVVDDMVDRGMRTLTGTQTAIAAWETILPDYQAGEVVAIKVNFNDAIMGGGISGYGDNDAYVDALPQVVNSVIAGLIARGVAEDNIRVFDASRYITDRFRALIDYPGVQYYDRYGNGSDVQASTFDSALASAQIDFSGSGYPAASSTHKISDVLIDSDYLINMPIMKKHGGAGITLALKNHLGSINGFVSGGHAMHNYFYLNGSSYSAFTNPMVDINDNPHIRDKTVLIIGDALYAGWRSNNTPPERWGSFGNDSPNMLFFAVDPVAVDSVMFDFIDREGSVYAASEDILLVAANAGMGVHERWNDDDLRQYTAIDYIEVDLDSNQPPPTPPSGLSATVVSATRIDLVWSPSTAGDVAVNGYNIYRDGIHIDSTTTTTYADTGLLPNTSYRYAISAYDGGGSESSACTAINATTDQESGGASSGSSSGSGGGCFLGLLCHTIPRP